MKRQVAVIAIPCSLLLYSAVGQEFSGERADFGTNVWQAAEGILPTRMLALSYNGQFPLYRTLWARNDGDLLVCLRDRGIQTYGTRYSVAVVRSNMRIIRRGEITAQPGDTPYCIAEVMSSDEQLPDKLRNKWLLAVGFWRSRPWPGGSGKPPQEFYFELAAWDDNPAKLKYGAGNLYYIPALQIRWIERGANILLRAIQFSDAPYSFKMPSATVTNGGTKAGGAGERTLPAVH